MPKFTVQVQYDASREFEIEADTIEQAKERALTKAYSDLPEELYAYVYNVMDEEGDDIDGVIDATN